MMSEGQVNTHCSVDRLLLMLAGSMSQLGCTPGQHSKMWETLLQTSQVKIFEVTKFRSTTQFLRGSSPFFKLLGDLFLSVSS